MTEKCDFCNQLYPQWYYDTPDFTMELWLSDMTDHRTIHDEAGYAACDTCADLIDKGDRTRLAVRSAFNFQREHPNTGMDSEMLYGAILDIHESGFWRFKQSERKRIGDAK